MVTTPTNAERVQALREANPLISGANMAKELELSRQRISQILAKLELPTRFYPSHKECPNCKIEFEVRRNRKYCSRECANAGKVRTELVIKPCEGCGVPVTRRPYRIRTKSGRVWCSRTCMKQFLSRGKDASIKISENQIS
jgi:hypothetical protein